MSIRVTGSSSASKIAGDASTVIGVTDSVSDTVIDPAHLSFSCFEISARFSVTESWVTTVLQISALPLTGADECPDSHSIREFGGFPLLQMAVQPTDIEECANHTPRAATYPPPVRGPCRPAATDFGNWIWPTAPPGSATGSAPVCTGRRPPDAPHFTICV